MAINLEFETHQKLLRAAGLMSMSVQALSNKLLRGACEVLDAEAIQKMMNESAKKAARESVKESGKAKAHMQL